MRIVLAQITRTLRFPLRPFAPCLILLCAALPACVPVATVQSNNLTVVPAEQSATRPPTEVAFIVHLYGMPGGHNGVDDPTYDYLYLNRHEYKSEAVSWRAALEGVAAPDHILITDDKTRSQLKPEFAAFCRTHPVVDIYNHLQYRRVGIFPFLGNLGAYTLDTASLGLLPIPYHYDYIAEFRLTLPPAQPADSREDLARALKAPAAQKEYPYRRSALLSPLLFLPIGDEYYFCDILPACALRPVAIPVFFSYDLSDWRTNEKRKLVAMILRDIRPQLAQYAQRATPVSRLQPPNAGE